MTPAAQNGIQIICSAKMASPGKPNSMTSAISMITMPSQGWRA